MNGNNWVGGMKNVQWSGDNDRIQGIKFWMSDINFHLFHDGSCHLDKIYSNYHGLIN